MRIDYAVRLLALVVVFAAAIPPAASNERLGSDWFDLTPGELGQRVESMPPDAEIPGDVWDRLWGHWTPEQKQAVQRAFRQREIKRIEETSSLTGESSPVEITIPAGDDWVLQGPGVVTGGYGLGMPSPVTLSQLEMDTLLKILEPSLDPFQEVKLPPPVTADAPDPERNATSENHYRNRLKDELTGEEFEAVEDGYNIRKQPTEHASITYARALTAFDPDWFETRTDLLWNFLSDPEARRYILSRYADRIPKDVLISNPYVLIERIRNVTESTNDTLWWFVDMHYMNNWTGDTPDSVTVLEGLDRWARDWMTRYPQLVRYFYADPDTRKILEARLDEARLAQLRATMQRLDANTYYIEGADQYDWEIIYGALLVQQQYISDLQRFRLELTRLRNMTPAEKAAYVRELQEQASLLQSAHLDMIYKYRAATTIRQGNAESHDLHGVWEKEYNDLIKAGKKEEAADTRWGRYLAARSNYIKLLDQNPILGLKPHTLLKDNFLWYAFMHTVFESNQDRIDLLDTYIDANITYVDNEIGRASAVEEVDDLLEFGSPRYLRQQQSVIGNMNGMGLLQASAWVNVLVGHVDVKNSEQVVQNLLVEGSLSLVAGLGWFIPVVGPTLAITADVVLVYRAGDELVVQYYDAEDAEDYAGITGFRYYITEEDKKSAAAGKFVFTSLGAFADIAAGTTAIKFLNSSDEALDVAGAGARATGLADDATGGLLPGLKTGDAPDFRLPGVSDEVNEFVGVAAREGVPGDVIESIVNRYANNPQFLETGTMGVPKIGELTPEGQIAVHNELVIAAANAQDLTILVQKGVGGRLPGQSLGSDLDELLDFAGGTRPVNPVLETDLTLLQQINAKVATRPKPPPANATPQQVQAYQAELQAWSNGWTQEMIGAVENGILPRADADLLKMWEWNPYEATGALNWQSGQLGGLNQVFTPDDLAAIRNLWETGPPQPGLAFNPMPAGPIRVGGQPPRPGFDLADTNVGAFDPNATLPFGTTLPLPGTVPVVPRPANVQVIDDGIRLLDDLDASALGSVPRFGDPGDAAFFRQNGLEPKMKVDIDGQTFYLSEPFTGPGARIAVIAYQVSPDGKLIPRTWYISKEHGLWRAAFAADGDGLIHKGPRAMVDDAAYMNGDIQVIGNLDDFVQQGGRPKDLFVNEAAANLDPRLQATLGDWVGGRPVRNLGDATDRAFFGHVEQTPVFSMGAEFQQMVHFDDVFFDLNPLGQPGMRPDLSHVQGRWQLPADHPYYPNAEVMSVPSMDGTRVYTVVRDADGNVFVPTINESGAGLTGFGTPTRVGNAGPLVDTPWQKVGGEYAPVRFGNDLNGFFAQNWDQLAQQPVRSAPFVNLPPGSAVPPAGLSPTTLPPLTPWWDIMGWQGARMPFFVALGNRFNWMAQGQPPLVPGDFTLHVMQPGANAQGAPVLQPAANQPVLLVPFSLDNTAFPGDVPFSGSGFGFDFPKGITDSAGMLTFNDAPLMFSWGPPVQPPDHSLYTLDGLDLGQATYLNGPGLTFSPDTGFGTDLLGGETGSIIIGGEKLDPSQGVLPGMDPWLDDAFHIQDTKFQIYLYPQILAPRFDAAVDKLGAGLFSEPNHRLDAAKGAPVDELFVSRGSWGQDYDDQWALKAVGLNGSGESVWPVAADKPSSTIVAVIDTGLDWHHPDINPKNIWRNENEVPDNGKDDDGNGYVDDVIGWDFIEKDNKPWDYDGHGTLVAGIIAAAHNTEGIAGVDPNVRIMVLKGINNLKQSRASYIAKAMVYAVDNGARVINLSVSGKNLTRTGRMAVDYARSKGVLVVVAAGNAGAAAGEYAPAAYPGVLTVAATGPDGKRANFSNWGPEIDIAAPGVEVLSLRARGTDALNGMPGVEYAPRSNVVGPYGRYYRINGTSFSAPLVTGAASLLLSRNPGLELGQVERLLLQSARDIDAAGIDQYSGYGLLDAAAALQADPSFFIDAVIDGVSVVNVDGAPHVRVAGTAGADKLKQAWIEIGAGEAPDKWKKVATIGKVVEGGALGDIPAGELAQSKHWVIRLVVEHENGRQRENWFVLKLG